MSFKFPMNNIQCSILIVGLFFLHSCKNETTSTTSGGNSVYEKTIPSKVSITKKDGKFIYTKTEASFDILELVGKESSKLLLTIEKEESRELSQDANAKKKITFSAKSIEGTKIDWTKEIEAADIDYSSKVLSAHASFDGNQEDTYTFYNIRNGDKIMDFTYGELKAIIPNTSEKRFFTYLSKNNSIKAPVEKDGIIQYASSQKLIQQISIAAKGKVKVPDYTPELQVLMMKESGNQLTPDGKSILLTKVTENFTAKDLTGFAFQINYYNEGEQEPYKIILPVDNDQIDLENAIYDKAIFELKLVN